MSESPQTSIRIIDSPDCPGSSSFQQNIRESPCSTPITRKRFHFIEESPSQDYDMFNLAVPSSQDIIESNILDVGWKWDESPKCGNKIKNINKRQEKSTVSSVAGVSKQRNLINTIKNIKKKPILNKVAEKEQGFYRFRQELMKIKSLKTEDLILNIEECDELDSSFKKNETCTTEFKENQDETRAVEINLNNKMGNKTSNLPESDVNNLFDDSDADNLILELSQNVESEINSIQKSKETVIPNDKLTKSIKDDYFENDSFDDILLSVPLDFNQRKNDLNVKTTNTSFSRYKSMPINPVNKNDSSQSITKTLLRHNSMPENESNILGKTNIIPSTSSTSSSTSSGNINKPKVFSSSLEDIERRRQEAKQRLMLTKQRRGQITNIKK